jgi:hypothetical protein
MKTFVRMVGFAVIGYVVAGAVASAVMLATMLPLFADVPEGAVQGLRATVDALKTMHIANIVFWPILAGTIYGLERLRRAARLQPAQPVRLTGLLRWLGAATGGFMIALWAYSVCNLLLLLNLEQRLSQPGTYGPEIAQIGRQIEAAGTVSLVVWIVAAILIGWRSRRLANTPPGAPLGHQPS